MAKKKYYVVKGKSGLFELRQKRFEKRYKCWKSGKCSTDHPHDVCAIARSKTEMTRMRKKFKMY